MLSKEPERIHHDWDAAVVAHCDFCSHSEMTVPHADGGKICASCCDAEALSNWQSYARDLATELISLREQLAELKALEPFCHVFLHPDGPLFNGIVSDSCAGHAGVIPLFTAAKPAED